MFLSDNGQSDVATKYKVLINMQQNYRKLVMSINGRGLSKKNPLNSVTQQHLRLETTV